MIYLYLFLFAFIVSIFGYIIYDMVTRGEPYVWIEFLDDFHWFHKLHNFFKFMVRFWITVFLGFGFFYFLGKVLDIVDAAI